jgi:hypothetical protein
VEERENDVECLVLVPLMQLSLADRSITYPYGILQDVLVRCAEFVFPADFVILDMEENSEVPILLGRPFLATGRALIDVEMGDLMLRLNDEQINFNIFEGMKNLDDNPQCFKVEVVEKSVEVVTQEKNEGVEKAKAAKRAPKKKRKKWKSKRKKLIIHPVLVEMLLVDHNLAPLKNEQKRSRVETNVKYPP